MEESIEFLQIEKDSGMESIVSSKDETPERKTVCDRRISSDFTKFINLFIFSIAGNVE